MVASISAEDDCCLMVISIQHVFKQCRVNVGQWISKIYGKSGMYQHEPFMWVSPEIRVLQNALVHVTVVFWGGSGAPPSWIHPYSFWQIPLISWEAYLFRHVHSRAVFGVQEVLMNRNPPVIACWAVHMKVIIKQANGTSMANNMPPAKALGYSGNRQAGLLSSVTDT